MSEAPTMNASRYIIRLNRVDVLTLSAVLTTALATACALQGRFYLATALLFLAMLGDALDGMLARKLKLERSFGRYLDGFMDTLIYLVLPALILYLHGFNGVWSLFLLPMLACGCIRLAVFNDIGNIQESSGLAYLGMPVFWSVFMLAAYLLLDLLQQKLLLHLTFLPQLFLQLALAGFLLFFSHAMLLRRPFFKFKKLAHILALTLGGFFLFLSLNFMGTGHV